MPLSTPTPLLTATLPPSLLLPPPPPPLLPPMVPLLAPGTWRVFRKPLTDEISSDDKRLPLLSTLALLVLAVALSAGLTDALDWSIRTIAETMLGA